MKKDPTYKEGLAERYRAEQKFGEAKTQHGLGRYQYLGLLGCKVQGYLTAIVMNLKRIVKVVAGVAFRSQGMIGVRKGPKSNGRRRHKDNCAQRDGTKRKDSGKPQVSGILASRMGDVIIH